MASSSLVAQTFPTKVIVDHGPADRRINILVMGDGYLSSELDKFEADAQLVITKLFDESPYKEYANFFNAIIVRVPSNESGTDHPATATDVTEPVFPQGTKDTYFGTTFDGGEIHRAVVTANSSIGYSTAAANFPSYDQILILVNSPEYGGTGGALATISTHSSSAEIAIHEMGHSFAKLADEYWPGWGAERPNLTANTDPNTVKWKNWMNTNGIGIYQHCCGGTSAEWYRPHEHCKMRELGVPFCSVCVEQTIDRIYQLVNPIDVFSPSSVFQTYTGGDFNFLVNLVAPSPNTLKVEWDLDGTVIASGVTNINLTDVPTGESTLTVTVADTTGLSRKYPVGYVFSESWEITNNMVAIKDVDNRMFYKIFPNPVTETLSVSFDGDFPADETEIQLVTTSGQVVFLEKKMLAQKSILAFSVREFPKGSYFLKIKRGNIRQSVPVVLE